jgi:DNA gyrase subunit B
LYPSEVLETLIYHSSLSSDDLSDESKVNSWTEVLVEKLNDEAENASQRYESDVQYDKERNLFLPNVIIVAHSMPKGHIFSHDFFASKDYAALLGLGEKISGLIEDGGFFKRGEKVFETQSFKEGLAWLMVEAQRGYNIQRYKGLGEMNPEQLWETTMDPEVRRMLQVTIEDAISADQMFTCLMGDQVEPRREFIEENALKVANLDV